MKKVIRLTESELVETIKKGLKSIKVKPIEEYTPSNPYERKIKIGDREVYLHNVDANTVQEVLNDLPKDLNVLGVKNCEGADFSNVNLCDNPYLHIVVVKGTPNNFEETIDCEYINYGGGVYDFPNAILNEKLTDENN
jgi:hypothetical protein